ncbi:hypothetical protein V6N12_058306 [Hibiscus sabdariffa]|uniref:Uncharacterized protein n=1 Tax=Hibiscus sabdariffa TaxID=183260 RepID=A0ABR2ETL5_9ROSI
MACSPLWSEISRVWDALRDNIYWLARNHSSLRFWDDTWIPSLGPIRPLELDDDLIDPSLQLCDFVVPDGSWDLCTISNLLP